MAKTKNLVVKFTSSGFNELRQQLQDTGRTFQSTLKDAQKASQEAIAASRKAAVGSKEYAEAEKAMIAAAKSANSAIAGSFRELRVKSTLDIEKQKQSAIAAFEAIRNSGTASAQDIANAQAALKRRLEELDGQLDQTKGKTNGLGEGFTVLKGVMANLISSAFTAAIQTAISLVQNLSKAVVGFGVSSVQAFMSFDAGMKAFAAKSGGATEEQIKAVREEAERLGVVTSKTPAQIAKMAAELAAAGFTADQTKQAMAGIVMASEASGESLETAGQIVGAVLNQFRLGADQSQRVADVLTAAANGSAASIGSLGEGLKYIGPVAGAANQSIEDMAIAVGLLTNAGLEGGQAGRNLASAFERLQKASAGISDGTLEGGQALKAQEEALRTLGVQFRQADGQMRPFLEVLPEMNEAFKRLSFGQQDLIRTRLFGTEGGRAINALLSQVDTKMQGLTESVKNADGAAQETSQALMKGLGPALEQLQSSIEVVQGRLGEAIAPALDYVVRLTMGWVNELLKIPGLMDGVKGLSEQVVKFFEANPEIIKSINAEMTDLVKGALSEAVSIASDLMAYLKENPKAIADTIREAATLAGGALKATANITKSILGYFRENKDQVNAIKEALMGVMWVMGKVNQLILKALEGWGLIFKTIKDGVDLVKGTSPGYFPDQPKPQKTPQDLTTPGEALMRSGKYGTAGTVAKNPTPPNQSTSRPTPRPSSPQVIAARMPELDKMSSEREKYLEESGKQYDSLTKQIQDKQEREARSVEQLQETINSTIKNILRSNRAIAEAYQDFAFDLGVQIQAARNSLADITNDITVGRQSLANMDISFGNPNSIARQVANIFTARTQSMFSLESNERQIKLDLLNLEKERVGRLRQIRSLEEANQDAVEENAKTIRNLNRQITDLGQQFKSSSQQIQTATVSLVRFVQKAIASGLTTLEAGNKIIRSIQAGASSPILPQGVRLPAAMPTISPQQQQAPPQNIQELQQRYGPQSSMPQFDKAQSPFDYLGEVLSDNLPKLNFEIGALEIGGSEVAQLGGWIEKGLNQLGNFLEGKRNKEPQTLLELARFYTRQNQQFLDGLDPILVARKLAIGTFENKSMQSAFNNLAKSKGFPQPSIGAISNPLAAIPPARRNTPAQSPATQPKPPVNYPELGTVKNGKIWAGPSYGWQSQASYNKLRQQQNIQRRDTTITTPGEEAMRSGRSRLVPPKPQPKREPVQFNMGDRLTLAAEYVQLYNQSQNLGMSIAQMRNTAKSLAEYRVADRKLQLQFEQYLQISEGERQAAIQNLRNADKDFRTLGTEAVLNGKKVLWAGKDYKWQSPESYQKIMAGSQPTKAPPPTIQAQATITSVPNPLSKPGNIVPQSSPAQGFTYPEGVGSYAPPSLDYDALRASAAELDSINAQIMSGRMEKNEVDMLTVNKQRLEDLVLVQKSLIELNRQNAQSYFDQVISVQQMQSVAKGYLTRLEAVNQTGLNVYMTYENQLRTLDDQSRAITLQLEGQEELRLNVQQQLDTAQELTEEERQQYQTTLDGIIAEGTRLGQHKTKLDLLSRELKLSQSIASTNAMERDAFERDLKAYQTYLGAMVEVAREGNGVWDKFFNVAPIIEAKAAIIEVERQAFYEGIDAGLDGDRLTEFIEMKKKLADIRLGESYAEAIPYTREFLDGLRASVTEGGNLDEVFKSVLQRINDIAYDISATILTGWVNKNLGSMLGIGKTSVPAFEQTQGILSAGNTATTGTANPVVSGATVAGGALTQLATAAEGGAQSLTGDFTTAIVDSSAGHLGAMAEFVASLQIARNAVISFAQSLPIAAAVTGDGGGILGTLDNGLIAGLFGGGSGLGQQAIATGTSLATGFSGQAASAATSLVSSLAGGFTGFSGFNFAKGIDAVMGRERAESGGKKPLLAVVHEGEAILSTLNGDAQKFQALKKIGAWDQLQIPNFAKGALSVDSAKLLSSLNTSYSPTINLPASAPIAASQSVGNSNTSLTVNINDKNSKYFTQPSTLARHLVTELNKAR